MQFLGAVTQSSPMMIVTEYLPKVIPFCFSSLLGIVSMSWPLKWTDYMYLFGLVNERKESAKSQAWSTDMNDK